MTAGGLLLRMKQALRLRTRFARICRWAVRHRGGWLLLHDWWVDRRLGASCGWTVASPFADRGATQTESCSYRTLARLFGHPLVRINEADVLVDVGCGKGRVINYWLLAGLRNRIVGIELTPLVGEVRPRPARATVPYPFSTLNPANTVSIASRESLSPSKSFLGTSLARENASFPQRYAGQSVEGTNHQNVSAAAYMFQGLAVSPSLRRSFTA